MMLSPVVPMAVCASVNRRLSELSHLGLLNQSLVINTYRYTISLLQNGITHSLLDLLHVSLRSHACCGAVVERS